MKNIILQLLTLREPPDNQHQFQRYHGHGVLHHAKTYDDIWSNTWLWEILSIIFSSLCFVLTLVLLKVFDQKPLPQFAYGITLNAIISILTAFSKSALLVAVAGAISQLKWRWYQNTKGRSVLDTQLFDDASRGPWGSLILLVTPHSWSLVSMGALVTILALAFDPFAQQLITYPYSKNSGLGS
jgi:cellulose synthase/poly-beta-1,6-N-acetylglucosamine synthase-like glycosyltransferase